MKFERYERKMGRRPMTFPNMAQLNIRLSEADHITHLLSVMSHNHGWEFFVKKGMIKITANKEKKGVRTFLIIPKIVIIKSGFTKGSDGKGYPIYRYMPNKNTIMVVQNKNMLEGV